ncbi:MAG: carbohydrate porin [Ignavibacteriales bacterium]|nr:carbohydrate porin [Ignavibacteriales bacterium]
MRSLMIAFIAALCLQLSGQDILGRNMPDGKYNSYGEDIKAFPQQDESTQSITWGVKLIHDIFTHSGEALDFHILHFSNPSVTWDLGRSTGLENMLVNVQFLGIYNFNKPLHFEPAQGVSNIAADNVFKLYQWSIQKSFPEQGLSFYLGLYDYNSEFDTRNSSALFLNPSHGIGIDISQSGKAGPSIFPNPSFALRAGWEVSDNMHWLSAVIDAVPGLVANPSSSSIYLNAHDGYIIANELQFTGDEKEPVPGFGKAAFGAWYYTALSEELQNAGRAHNYGIYCTGEQYFHQSLPGSSGTAAFIRAGFANSDVNCICFYAGAGISLFPEYYSGTCKTFGVSVAYSNAGQAYRITNPGARSYELITELTMVFQPHEAFSLQPDIQFVNNPLDGGKDVLFAGLRVQLEY